jgi:hypothetical protein
MPIRRSDSPNVVIKTPGTPPPPNPALMSKIAKAEQQNKPEQAKAGEASAAEKAAAVSAEKAAAKPGADNVKPGQAAKQGIRGPNYQPIGMDPRQAKALGILVLEGDEGLDTAQAEEQLDEIWYSLSDKERLAVGRTERFRVDMDQKLLRMARSQNVPHQVRGQLSQRTIERGKRNAFAEYGRYEHLLADDTRALLKRFIEETAALVELSYRAELIRGAPSEDLADLQVDLARKLVYQDLQSRLRRMGDRGIRHVMGNIDVQERLLDALHGKVEITARDRLLGRVIQVHHDLGYCCHASQVSYQAGRMHRHYSVRIFNDEWNRYRRIIPPKDLQRARDAIIMHAHLDYNWIEDPLGSAVRVADHLMAFSPHWIYPHLSELEGSAKMVEAINIAAKNEDQSALAAPKKALWDAVMKHQGFAPNFKEDLLAGLRPFEKGAYAVDLGALSGVVDGARFDPQTGIMEVALRQDDNRRHLQGLFDVGQDQFFFFARKRGANENEIRAGGPVEMRCRESGPVALRLFVGSLPERKLQFNVRRPGRLRGGA